MAVIYKTQDQAQKQIFKLVKQTGNMYQVKQAQGGFVVVPLGNFNNSTTTTKPTTPIKQTSTVMQYMADDIIDPAFVHYAIKPIVQVQRQPNPIMVPIVPITTKQETWVTVTMNITSIHPKQFSVECDGVIAWLYHRHVSDTTPIRKLGKQTFTVLLKRLISNHLGDTPTVQQVINQQQAA